MYGHHSSQCKPSTFGGFGSIPKPDGFGSEAFGHQNHNLFGKSDPNFLKDNFYQPSPFGGPEQPM